MKKFFKFGCLSVVGLIVLIVIISIAAGGGGDTTEQASGEPSSSETSSGSEETNSNQSDSSNSGNQSGDQSNEESVDPAKITAEEFKQIENGMTYEEVVQIIGSEGELTSETGEQGSQFHTVIYTWTGEGIGANASLTFQGGELTNKSQFGVGEGTDVTITMEEFGQLENGMTYEEVQEIVGGPGSLDSETGEEGSQFHTVIYSYPGESIGSSAMLTFQGGTLNSKTQFGLE